ncbi:hypothetical protein KKP62_28950 [Rhodococcus sp. GOMB7]|uniref:hypothetical protein n=1 Tax=unclassified Rhodococcus (in: high G+C Gram-positive bacteria) TaxID=192944 RepID=UPI0015F3F2F0|nr:MULTISPECIES: hypothetical protein [unclassified Rhodococcus (in: high G+C Gram-positive bacteria)]MBT9299004.1 hypothetical protein [Rhodococcus sp. GOMB7]MCC4306277.1 hypothetical protein [Rhodococcus sp. 3-2]
MLEQFEAGKSYENYRESVAETIIPQRTSGYYRDLTHQAYEARGGSKVRRVGLAHLLATRILSDGHDHGQSRIFEAEALHIVSVPLASEIPPAELSALLVPCAVRLNELRRQNPELGRYCGLIERTVSMSASKLDRYTGAFAYINRAHIAMHDAPHNSRNLTKEEALQQLYLQECGQLARNVEAALVEQDAERRALLRAGNPPTRSLRAGADLRAIRIVARASAEAGARACRLLDKIATEVGLPAVPDPEERRLATASWFLTSNIMYMRSLLLAATVEQSAGSFHSTYLQNVPDLFARVVEVPVSSHMGANAAPSKSHLLDLTRIALHWSFLNHGAHPYIQRPLSLGIRRGVPPHLIAGVDGNLDAAVCSAYLTSHGHDAGILDILAHSETYLLFTHQGGIGAQSFQQWLIDRRANRIVAQDDPDTDEIRKTQRPTHQLMVRSAKMVIQSGRYREVLDDA